MKHKAIILVIVSIFFISSLGACGLIGDLIGDKTVSSTLTKIVPDDKETQTKPSATPKEEPTQMPIPTATEVAIDYEAIYSETLNRFYYGLSHGIEDWDYGTGEVGLLEFIMNLPEPDALERVGYTIQDLNGDKIPELLIVHVDEPGTDQAKGKMIYAAFSATQGQPELIFEGWYRNAYYYLGGDRIYNTASAGAMYSIFGTLRLSPDGKKLDCEDYYFTYEKDESMEEIGYYHNTICEMEKSVSTELEGGQEAFEQTSSAFARQIQTLTITPFSKYQPSAPYTPTKADKPVSVEWVKDTLKGYTDYHEFVADTTEHQVQLLISTEKRVENFKFLGLFASGADENYNIIFDIDERYALDALTPEKPLLVKMTFFGDLPSYGFSFDDETGKTRYFSISLSGYDGSIIVNEFSNAH